MRSGFFFFALMIIIIERLSSEKNVRITGEASTSAQRSIIRYIDIILVPNYIRIKLDLILAEFYRTLAKNYDKYYRMINRTTATFVQNSLPLLSSDDQLVDVGSGTGQVALMVKSDMKIKKPVVCVEPMKEMFDIASMKKGITSINATAEEFFSSKPEYPLKVVLMNGCVHLFTDLELVFEGLAKYLQDDGMCIITAMIYDDTYPFFEAAKNKLKTKKITPQSLYFRRFIESKGLKCKMINSVEPVKVEKKLWYEAIRNRFSTVLINFSDEELEEGITELEKKYSDVNTIKFDLTMVGLIVTK